jgi:hypothetical protein
VSRRLVNPHPYHDLNGREVFQHPKWRLDPPERGRSKKSTYRWRTRPGHVWINRKPPGADAVLYRLPELLVEVGISSWAPACEVWWCEGERDADTLAGLGLVATSHHQGAEVGATIEQAQWFAGYRGTVVLAVDRDAPGAVDAVRRYDLLRAVGIPSRRLRLVRTPLRKRGADVSAHVEAGLPLADLVTVPIGRMRLLAARATPADFRRAGYGPVSLFLGRRRVRGAR